MQRLLAWIPPVLFTGFIFTLSTGSFSSEHTGRVITPLLHWLLPFASADTLEDIHWVIRKGMHVTEYCILGLLLFRAIRTPQSGWTFQWALWAVLLAGAYGATDEIHQIFVPGRGPAVHDVMIDTSGAILGQILLWLWLRRYPGKTVLPQTEAKAV